MNKIKFVCLHNSFNYADVDRVLVIVNRVCTILIISEGIKFNSFVNTIESNRYSNWNWQHFIQFYDLSWFQKSSPFYHNSLCLLNYFEWNASVDAQCRYLWRNCFLKFTKSYFTILWSFMGSEIVVIARDEIRTCM